MSYSFMIVDDSLITQSVIARTLQMCEFEVGDVHLARNGADALALLESHRPDMVFCDINMPVMNGLEFLSTLRQSESWSDLPVVMVSSDGSRTRIDDLIQQGIHGYIRKPFTPEQIASVVERVLGGAEHAG